MKIDVLTLFPEMFPGILNSSILGRAQAAGILTFGLHNIRDYADNKHKQTDDYPFGGGQGMVMTPQPVFDCFAAVIGQEKPKPRTIYLSPRGKTLTPETALEGLEEWDSVALLSFIALMEDEFGKAVRGGRVKVIHKVSRNIDEMFEVIRRWLPFYVSGAIEPYYYPRLRDGIYKRTLSVIPGVAATFSTSIGQQTGVVTTFMTRERLAVDSFTNEFSSYVALCRPLIEFFTMSTLVETFQSYLACAAVTNILRSDGLSFTTLPDSVLQRISGMYDASMEAALNQIHNAWGKKFSDNASQCSTYHLLRLAPPEEVAAGRTPISCAGMLRGEPVYYRPEEYCAQLENILALMERYPWFQVCLDEGEREGYTLHIFEEQDVYLFKEEPPYIIFRIREPNTVAAFWDYMQRTVEDLRQERPAVCRRIREHMEQIRRAMEDRGIQFM